MEIEYRDDGTTIKEEFNPETGVYSTYDVAGTPIDERVLPDPTWARIIANKDDLSAKVAAQIPDLLVMIADLNTRLDVPKADLSNTELRRTIRDVRVLARVVTQLVRLMGNVLDSTDSGN